MLYKIINYHPQEEEKKKIGALGAKQIPDNLWFLIASFKIEKSFRTKKEKIKGKGITLSKSPKRRN